MLVLVPFVARAETPEEIQALHRAQADYNHRVYDGKVSDPAARKKIHDETIGKVVHDIGARKTRDDAALMQSMKKGEAYTKERDKAKDKAEKLSPNKPSTGKKKQLASGPRRVQPASKTGAASSGRLPPATADTSTPDQPTTVLDGSAIPKELEFSGKKKAPAPAPKKKGR